MGITLRRGRRHLRSQLRLDAEKLLLDLRIVSHCHQLGVPVPLTCSRTFADPLSKPFQQQGLFSEGEPADIRLNARNVEMSIPQPGARQG
jgi:hypothetical protein